MNMQIDHEAKRVLEPFGMIFAGMYEGLREMSDEDLAAFIKGCEQVSQTNCWFAIYKAANSLKDWAETEANQRRHEPARLIASKEGS
jgi:hypothetical protein